jgi:hypothetical protein
MHLQLLQLVNFAYTFSFTWLVQVGIDYAERCPLLLLLGVQGAALDESYSLAALALALHEVPRAWAQQARKGPRVMPLQVRTSMARNGRCYAAYQAV